MRLRSATPADLDFLVGLRNEEVNARHSKRGVLTRDEIERDYFDNPAKVPLVAELGGEPVGYVILATLDERRREISVALVPEVRGQGRGAELVRLASVEHLDAHPEHTLVADILPGNAGSIRTFERAGYRFASRDSDLVTYVFERADRDRG